MYQDVTQFQPITNRESWQQLIGIYDDSTGDPINLSNTGGVGTYANWVVQTSAALYGTTLLTVPSVSSLSIANGVQNAVVATGLAILPGQYVNFLYQPDNTQFMTGIVNSYNSATGAIQFTVASMTMQLEIRRIRNAGDGYSIDGYSDTYGEWGSIDCNAPILSASIGNGISIVDIGIIQVYFSETSMRSLGRGMHSVAATLASADGVDVRQLFLGRLPVFFGGVTN
jgi:hypothetical protein